MTGRQNGGGVLKPPVQMIFYPILPCPKPRQTHADRWKKRPCVLRYRSFCDQCRLLIKTIPECPLLIFILPFPQSWSNIKKATMGFKPHTGKEGDCDNFAKALFDALYEQDKAVWCFMAIKLWGEQGRIGVADLKDFQLDVWREIAKSYC